MTREKALEANRLLLQIETYEAIIEELRTLESLESLYTDIDDRDLEDELVAVVQARLDKVLKELEKL